MVPVSFYPEGSGKSGVITRYELSGSEFFSGYTSAFNKLSLKQCICRLSGGKYTNVINHSVTPDVTGAVKRVLEVGIYNLLKTDDSGGWRAIRSWQMHGS